jgi:hypothetical protein
MKNIMDQRIRRIEDLLRDETEIGMVASKTDRGIFWNGITYPDEESLSEAVKTICGRKAEERPLVIIDVTHCRTDAE